MKCLEILQPQSFRFAKCRFLKEFNIDSPAGGHCRSSNVSASNNFRIYWANAQKLCGNDHLSCLMGRYCTRAYEREQGEVLTSDPQSARKCLQVEAQCQKPLRVKLKKKSLNQTAQESKLEKC